MQVICTIAGTHQMFKFVVFAFVGVTKLKRVSDDADGEPINNLFALLRANPAIRKQLQCPKLGEGEDIETRVTVA